MAHYDPDHQDADWSGYVTISSRRHVQGQKHGENEQWKPSKRIATKKSDSTFSLIGGPVPKDDPSTLDPCNWQSEAQAASAQTKTTTGQSTGFRKKKKPPSLQPVETVATTFSGEDLLMSSSRRRTLKENFVPLSNDPTINFVGFRHRETSLIANLGRDLGMAHGHSERHTAALPEAHKAYAHQPVVPAL